MTSIELAARFAEYICDGLTSEQLDAVNQQNAAPLHQNTCATHDYCDPNEWMILAIEDLGGEFDPQDSEQTALINDAWTLAKDCEFNPVAIRNCFKR
jgi:hypothetical protein